MQLLVNIFCETDICMLSQFVGALHSINNFFQAFAAEYFSSVIYPCNIKCNRQEYYPLLVEIYQHDCQALLSDIASFGKCIEPYLVSCKSQVKLNKYIHMAYSVSFYLVSVKKYNPLLWARIPQ